MRIILSPAKKMRVDSDSLASVSTPVFLSKAEEILGWMWTLSYTEAKKLWACNDKIAEENYARLQDMNLDSKASHSFQIKVEHKEAEPPAVLYHGTARRFLDSIMEKGLLPMGRQYVHMSADIETAEQVGRRRDNRPVILTIDAKQAAADGIKFYIGNDKVWLADQIPPQYLGRYDQMT